MDNLYSDWDPPLHIVEAAFPDSRVLCERSAVCMKLLTPCVLSPPLFFRWPAILLGIVVGHLYFFLTMKYPQEFGGRRLIVTPQFL